MQMTPTFTVVYKGKMFEVVQWEGKPGVTFEAAVRSPGTRLLIECSKNGEKGLFMTRELRREAGGYDYRVPGGKVFDSLEEYNSFRSEGNDVLTKAENAARKEGKEEAGAEGGEIKLLTISKAGASVEWDLYYFLVTGATFGEQELEEHERGDIETIQLSAKEIFEKLVSGEIKEGRSADVLWRWLATNNFLKFS